VGILRREGEYWTVSFDGETVRVRDSKVVRYLAELLRRPGTEIHSLDLVRAVRGGDRESVGESQGLGLGWGDAGEVLDPRAKAEYRQRIHDLEAELQEAIEWQDPARGARIQEELDFLTRELAGAVGLGGRNRRAASSSERARVNVTRAIKASVERLDESAPRLARHLRTTVRTGTFCLYEPDPRLPIAWRS
jgi:hypothetical protein